MFQRYLNSYFVKTTNQTKEITQRDQIHAAGYFNMLVSGAFLAFLAENVCADVGSVTNERRERGAETEKRTTQSGDNYLWFASFTLPTVI